MTLALIGIAFALVLCGVAFRADARFRNEDRLPMQWWLDGQVTWSAQRRIALALIPTLAIVVLIGTGFLNSVAQPRPGQEGLVIPSFAAVGLIFLGAQLFHIWMVAKTLQRNGR